MYKVFFLIFDSLHPNPLGAVCSCIAKPHGRGECGLCRRFFHSLTSVPVGILQVKELFFLAMTLG
jgi:hypothetical protein